VKLVLAYGNPLRGDDGAAWRIVESLERRTDVGLLCVHQLTPELVFRVTRAEGVVFVDAARDGVAGEVRMRPVETGGSDAGLGHVLAPGALLGLARRLCGGAPPAWLVTIGGRDFGFGARLSPPVAAALGEARAVVRVALTRLSRPVEVP
jgi:hydrogenase maturation protease